MEAIRRLIASRIDRLQSRLTLALGAAGLLLVGVASSVPTAHAAVGINKTLNYQGRLLTNTGAVVPDGTYNMKFRLYQDGAGTIPE